MSLPPARELKTKAYDELSPAPGTPVSVLRGPAVVAAKAAQRSSLEAYGDDPSSFAMGSLVWPGKALFHHIAAIGASGAGKSTLLDQLFRQCMERVHTENWRLFAWDFKDELDLCLGCYELPYPVHYVAPRYGHGVGVDVAATCLTDEDANQLAMDLIAPEKKTQGGGENMEWIRAAQSVFASVVKGFQQEAPGKWRLIDAFEATVTLKNLLRILKLTRIGRARSQEMLGNPNQARGVMFTLQGAAETMWSLAAAMNRTKNISIREWAYGPGSILVLPFDPLRPHVWAPFGRWVFSQAARYSLAAATTTGVKSVFFLDEVRHGPFSDYLLQFMTAGRGKGVACVVGMTDRHGLDDMLNENQAEEVLGSCSTQFLFRCATPKGAEWTEKLIGSQMVVEPKHTVTSSATKSTNANWTADSAFARQGFEALEELYLSEHFARPKTPGTDPGKEWQIYHTLGALPSNAPVQRNRTDNVSHAVAYEAVKRPIAMDSELQNLPLAGVVPGHGLTLTTWVVSAFHERVKMTATNMDHEDVGLHKAKRSELPRVERPPHELRYDGWTAADEARLNLPPETP